jgi:hypothetical protein
MLKRIMMMVAVAFVLVSSTGASEVNQIPTPQCGPCPPSGSGN